MTVLIWILSLLCSVFLGSVVVKNFNFWLKSLAGLPIESNRLTLILGCLERFFYTVLFYKGKYEFMALLFGLMAAQKLLSLSKIKDDGSKDVFSLYKKVMAMTNVYFISSLISLCFGILGGWIIKFLQFGC